MKVFKYLLLPLIGLIGLAAIAIFALFVLVDPNRYKPALESLFERQTELQLNIAGDINWTFRPVFGLSLEDVRIRNNESPQELASFSSVSLKVTPASVLGETLEIEEFVADDLHLNWIVEANGSNNWFPEGAPARTGASGQFTTPADAATAPSTAPAEVAGAETEEIAAEIQQITIRNARIAIQDAQSGLNTSLENLNLSSRDTNFVNRPFPVELSFRLIDYSGNRNLQLDFESTAAIDYSAGNARFSEIQLQLDPLTLNGHVEVTNFHEALAWSTELSSNQFNLNHFLENFIPPAADGSVLPGDFDSSEGLASVQLSASGNEAGISVPALQLTLDETQAQADIEFRYATANRPDTLVYRLDTNSIDIDRFLGTSQEELLASDAPAASEAAVEPTPDAESEAATQAAADPATGNSPSAPVIVAAPAAPAEEVAIPVELLNSMNVIGNHNIEHLRFSGLDFTDISMALKLESGILTVETQPVGFYEGQFAGLANLDASVSPPALTASAGLEGVNLIALSESVRAAEFATGLLNAESKYVATGNTLDGMLDTLTGSTTFNIAENSVNIAMIKQVFAAISALSPTGAIGANWPDTLSFTQFDGHLSFTEGLATGQELQLRMDNFNVTGSGGINLDEQRFDYQMEFIILGEPAVQTVPVNENYQGIAWPVSCEAEFSAEPREYCAPDYQRVRDLFAQIGRNEVERRVEEAIEDKVPEELQDAASGLLRNIFRR